MFCLIGSLSYLFSFIYSLGFQGFLGMSLSLLFLLFTALAMFSLYLSIIYISYFSRDACLIFVLSSSLFVIYNLGGLNTFVIDWYFL